MELDDVGDEVFEIYVRASGFEVVKSTPTLNKDANGRYAIQSTADTEVIFLLRKIDGKKPDKRTL